MSLHRNVKSREEIINELKNSSVTKVKVAITDIDGILRGKTMKKEKFLSVLEAGFGFCDVVFGWDSADVAYDNGTFTGWHSGYPDAKAEVDLNTFRKIPWDQETPFFLADFRDQKGNNLEICPRSLLKKVRAKAHSMGYFPIFAQEFEWFNFKETSEALHEKKFCEPTPMTPGMFGYSLLRTAQNREYYNDLFDLLLKFDIALEGIHTETGPGVYEAAILYDEILEAADKAVLFKAKVKEIAQRHGIMATFLAKWNENLPGCSGHVHQSLWTMDKKKNIFYDEKDPYKMSAKMKSYIAGQLYCLPKILPMFAPTINSYKRLVEGAWAPTTVTWAIDNRTCALRVLPGNEKSTRIEHRVVGSDTNAYLAMAAALASGLYGIEKNMKLDVPMTTGNGYRNLSNGILPKNLFESAQEMKNNGVATELFGEVFVKHFVETREWEWRQFQKIVTDWELKRYFEII